MSEAIKLSTLSLESVEGDFKRLQESVEQLLDNEQAAMDRFEEIGAMADIDDRLTEGAKLYIECESLAKLSKQMADVATRSKKRMEKVADSVKAGLHSEVEAKGGQHETADYLLKVVSNPPSVEITDFDAVPRKYRSEPKPLPKPDQWPVAKTVVKNALVKELVKSIPGVTLVYGERLEIKPR